MELDRYIQDQQEALNGMRGSGSSTDKESKQWDQHMTEIHNRTTHYGYMAKEVARSREDCVARHPSLREDRLEQLETAVE